MFWGDSLTLCFGDISNAPDSTVAWFDADSLWMVTANPAWTISSYKVLVNISLSNKQGVVYLVDGTAAINMIVRPCPARKVLGANMGPNWVLSAPDGPHVGPVNLAIRLCIRRGWSIFLVNSVGVNNGFPRRLVLILAAGGQPILIRNHFPIPVHNLNQSTNMQIAKSMCDLLGYFAEARVTFPIPAMASRGLNERGAGWPLHFFFLDSSVWLLVVHCRVDNGFLRRPGPRFNIR